MVLENGKNSLILFKRGSYFLNTSEKLYILILFLNSLEKGSIQERPARAHGWDSVGTWMEDDEMRRRVIAYLLSAASVYLAMGYMVNLFLSMMNAFTLPAL